MEEKNKKGDDPETVPSLVRRTCSFYFEKTSSLILNPLKTNQILIRNT